MDFNFFMNMSLKESQEILDKDYPGHRVMHIMENGRKVVLITGPQIKVSITEGEK